jgi:FMN-dependent NADH-azoreductase
VDPYLHQILGFMGIDDVQIVRAQDINVAGLAAHAIPDGEKTIEALAL